MQSLDKTGEVPASEVDFSPRKATTRTLLSRDTYLFQVPDEDIQEGYWREELQKSIGKRLAEMNEMNESDEKIHTLNRSKTIEPGLQKS